MSEVDNFISNVKVKRDDAVEKLLEVFVEVGKQNDALLAPLADLTEQAISTIDQLVGSILDSVEEHYSEFITAETDSGESVVVTCASDLATLYFEEVSN